LLLLKVVRAHSINTRLINAHLSNFVTDRTSQIIPIKNLRAGLAAEVPESVIAPTGLLTDVRKRRLHDLRISVTDRCNFRCTYCMPKSVFDKDYQYLSQGDLLSFEEIERLVKIFVAHGIEKIRLTGGEPLLRKNIEKLIEKLARIQTPNGKGLDLTLTTNASLLTKKAQSLKDAGLGRITVSLDGLSEAVFQSMNDVDFPVADVLNGIDAAARVGLGPVKINMVVKKGINDHEVLPMARHFKASGHILRFIEFMDVGSSNGWQMNEVVPSSALVSMISKEMPIEVINANYIGEVAERWRYVDGQGELGFISSVTQPFCGDCSRARLSTDGKLYTCLFATEGHDFRRLLREPILPIDRDVDEAITSAIAHLWQKRNDQYSEIRSQPQSPEFIAARKKVEMSYIGG
jgi:GTP 3',8-cyclase